MTWYDVAGWATAVSAVCLATLSAAFVLECMVDVLRDALTGKK